MKRSRLPWLGLRFYWRTNLAVVAGMAVGTAVLAGALIVGDSVRGSLRRMTLERLGRFDHALVSNRFFSEDLAERLEANVAFADDFDAVYPAIVIAGSAENASSAALARGVNILGVTEDFWGFDLYRPPPSAGVFGAEQDERVVILNEKLSAEIGARRGDDVLLRFRKPDAIPAEAVHGRRTGHIATLRLRVVRVIPNSGLGRFDPNPSQQLKPNAYLPRRVLQRSLEREGDVNALLVAAKPGAAAEEAGAVKLQRLLAETVDLGDLELKLRVNESPRYLSLESTRMVLRESDVGAALDSARALGARTAPTLTYLANTIASEAREIPYSIVTALDPTAPEPFGPLYLVNGRAPPALGHREILLNEWAAEELAAKLGDRIRLSYYVTGPFGEFEETESADFVLAGVVALQGAGRDPGLTPEYPGIHDAVNIRDWDPPFEIDLRRMREQDELYWERYRTTPKAFISLDAGIALWTTRFGRLTSLRVSAADGKTLQETADLLAEALRRRIEPESAALIFQPVKALGLESSRGASDFGGLFIAFSVFIIFSAMLLVRLLFSLGVERRAREIGLLLASGYTGPEVRRMFLAEGAALAVSGGAAGLALALGYAWFMLLGLKTLWLGSVGTTSLWMYVTPLSLAIGLVAGVSAGLLSVYFAVRSLSQAAPSRLLSGAGTEAAVQVGLAEDSNRKRRRDLAIANVALVAAVVSIVGSGFSSAALKAALFYVGGLGLMISGLFFISVGLRLRGKNAARPGSIMPVARLGVRNAARHHARSILTIFLVALATFVIVAVAANRHDAGHAEIEKASGNGGFALMAESDSPVLLDLNDPEARDELNVPLAAEPLFADTIIYPLRLLPGEDASCLNLYSPQRPRIVGAPKELIERGGFLFSKSLAHSEAERANPWLLLDREESGPVVPTFADANTATWILHVSLGETIEIEDDNGRIVRLKLVGLLKRSALQSELIISEANFIRHFPERGGHRFFMIETAQPEGVRAALEEGLRDYGFDVFGAQERLNTFLEVENTYLSTFQMLGGLGLLLGTLGLTTVMLRNVLERRGELALLRSFGYRSSALATLVLAENGFLLFLGLLLGAGSALAAVAPILIESPSSIPWGSLAVTLLVVAAVGMISAAAAVAAAIRSPLLEALRSP